MDQTELLTDLLDPAASIFDIAERSQASIREIAEWTASPAAAGAIHPEYNRP